jgi:hypothetical protein
MSAIYRFIVRFLPVLVLGTFLFSVAIFVFRLINFRAIVDTASFPLAGLTLFGWLLDVIVKCALLLGAGAVLRLRLQQVEANPTPRPLLPGAKRIRIAARVTLATAFAYALSSTATAIWLVGDLSGLSWPTATMVVNSFLSAARQFTLLIAAEAAFRLLSEHRITGGAEEEAAIFS